MYAVVYFTYQSLEQAFQKTTLKIVKYIRENYNFGF